MRTKKIALEKSLDNGLDSKCTEFKNPPTVFVF